jgi:hypothetical protein
MATRTVYLTPEEVRACVVERALTEVFGDEYDTKVEFAQTADGMAALVTFADKDAPRPASVLPVASKIPEPDPIY